MAETPSEPPGWPFNQPQPPSDYPPPRAYEPPPHPGYQPAPSQSFPAPGPANAQPPPPRASDLGQPPPPPFGTQYAPPPKRRRSRIWTVAALLIVGIIVLVGACTVWFVRVVSAPVDEANIFLAAIDDGDYGRAIAMTDPRCNAALTVGDLEQRFQGQRISYDLSSSSIVNSDASVTGRITIGSESQLPVRVDLRNSDGWQVCRIRVG